MISYLISLFYAGTFLLGCAIAINAVIIYLKIMNWYELLNHLKNRKWPKNMKIFDIVWLFIGYPLTLGFLVYLSQKFFF